MDAACKQKYQYENNYFGESEAEHIMMLLSDTNSFKKSWLLLHVHELVVLYFQALTFFHGMKYTSFMGYGLSTG